VLAYFSPLPPQPSGIADYSLSLLVELRRYYLIDLYHDAGYVPDLGPAARQFGCFDHRLFERRARVLPYHAVLYQIGNSGYHDFIYEKLLAHPGLVTLHDFYLGGLHIHRSRRPGADPDALEAEIAYERGQPDAPPGSLLPPRAADAHLLSAWLRHHGLWLSRRVLDRATGVVVHSEWAVHQAALLAPACLERTTIIPLGAGAKEGSAVEREAVRRRFALPSDALLIGCFGILSPTKLNAEAVEAFAHLARVCPSALLLFAGQDFGSGEVQARVAQLDLGERVRFLGHLALEDFEGLTRTVDIGVNLRRPPTNGESSAALLRLLGAGVPTLVTDVDTVTEFPEGVVCKVPYSADLVPALARALTELALDPARRRRLGRAALRHVRACHTWERVAARYAEFIDRCARRPGREAAPLRVFRPVHPAPDQRAWRVRCNG
jgi:glycosyltransferase involved in cell wall biosynthesis